MSCELRNTQHEQGVNPGNQATISRKSAHKPLQPRRRHARVERETSGHADHDGDQGASAVAGSVPLVETMLQIIEHSRRRHASREEEAAEQIQAIEDEPSLRQSIRQRLNER